jgi:hypothetical protein
LAPYELQNNEQHEQQHTNATCKTMNLLKNCTNILHANGEEGAKNNMIQENKLDPLEFTNKH